MRRTLAILKWIPAVVCVLLVVAWVVSCSESTQTSINLGWRNGQPGINNLGIAFGSAVAWYDPRDLVPGPTEFRKWSFWRFPLWSYFAWTALVAAELAFYLR